MKYSTLHLTIIVIPLLCTVSITKSQAQVQPQVATQSKSESQSPGGVAGFVKWVNGNDNRPVQIAGAGGLTFIGVGKIQKEGEQLLWNVSTQTGKTERVQTTARTANLTKGTFMNYAGRDTLPQLRLYAYSTSSANGTRGTFNVGGMTKEKLPVKALKNGMMEYVVYDRALTAAERMRVESALALRHGITLAHSYLNSKGETIRNYYRLKAYNHRVAGIIGDATSKLDRTTGESSESEAVIKVSAKSINEGASFLWGDNAKQISFANDKGNGKWMQRQWAATTTGQPAENLTLTFDTRSIHQLQPLEKDECYYLAVDNSGTGKFPVGQIHYYKAQDSHADSIVFAGIAAAAGESIFTLRAAKDFFATVEIAQPRCSTAEKGQLKVLFTGGTAPYNVTISLDGKACYSQSTSDSILTISNLQQGKYIIAAKDHTGKTLLNEIMVSNADMADVPELQDVHFSQGASRDYRLDTKSDYICRWKSPKGRYLSGESVTLDEDGEYLLELTNSEGCSTTRTLNVSTMAGDGFARYDVSPNPTTDGNVNIRVEMSESLPLELWLYSPDGALLQKEIRLSDTYHATRCYLPMNGVSILEMSSGNSRKTVKLIRK
ncbi:MULTISPECIES: hypothetical protein [Prevotella]|uniref:DUF8202 domain-containing protein n=1 Tax=Prevotella nigrescens CC14M TaxID=1073366 RepID=V8CKU1_9BACT|nr:MULTISPECIES: hypothetical protein [Prevotella]ETD27998.1 hypothetical protein HMPREF1173_02044 [Prevotella nigrescens CC14M]